MRSIGVGDFSDRARSGFLNVPVGAVGAPSVTREKRHTAVHFEINFAIREIPPAPASQEQAPFEKGGTISAYGQLVK